MDEYRFNIKYVPYKFVIFIKRHRKGGSRMCRVNELRCKEVINVKDGSRLGFVDDVEFDICTGKIVAITVQGAAKFFGIFGREEDYIIPWEDIQKIGSDIVLVCFEVPLRVPSQRAKGAVSGFFSSLFK